MAGSRGYQVRVRFDEELDSSPWLGGIDGLVVELEPDGTTVLSGQLRDQAELHGLLAAIRDLGLPLLSIESTQSRPHPKETSDDDDDCAHAHGH
jgi:hypothetical protein